MEIIVRFKRKELDGKGRITFDIAVSIYTNLIFGRQKSADLAEVRTKVGRKAIARNVGVGNARRLYRPPYLHLVVECNSSWCKSMLHPRRVHAEFRR